MIRAVRSALCALPCALCAVRSALCALRCALSALRCALCILGSPLCALGSVLSALLSVLCALCFVYAVRYVLCAPLSVPCAWCSVLDSLCFGRLGGDRRETPWDIGFYRVGGLSFRIHRFLPSGVAVAPPIQKPRFLRGMRTHTALVFEFWACC